MNSKLFAGGVAALTLGLTACGGGSTLSKSKLDSKANAICSTAQKKVNKVKQPTNITDAGAAAGYFDKILPIAQDETSKLKDLKPASSVKSDWNDFLDKQDQAISALKTIKEKADKKDASGLQDLKKFTSLGNQVSTAAKKVGASTCG